MIYDRNLQSTHCRDEPAFTGRWHSPVRDGTWWRVWSCADHVGGLTAVREFGRRH
jgi:sugar phosphate permease